MAFKLITKFSPRLLISGSNNTVLCRKMSLLSDETEPVWYKDPMKQFDVWFEEAKNKKQEYGFIEPAAMSLATVTKQGKPSSRIVICRSFDSSGFKFFTHYESRKSKEIEENPCISATFYWEPLNRSVKIEAIAKKLSEEENEKFFHSRPIEGQVAMAASITSTPLEKKEILAKAEKDIEEKYVKKGLEVPKPAAWGGYLLQPTTIEFWKGYRTNKLHDRIRFKKEGTPDGKLLHQGENGWVYERLYP